MIKVTREMGEYVAWAPDCLLRGFGATEKEARADLVDHAKRDYVHLNDLHRRRCLSRHMAALIPAIARLLAVEAEVAPEG